MKKLIALVLFLGIAPLAHSEDEGPSGTDALQAAGAALVEGDLGRAETLYQEALQSPTLGKKQQASAHYNLGCIYMSQKTPEKALERFDRALALFPEFPEALYGRGNYRTSQKEYRAAIADYTRAIELKPAYQQAFNNRGMCWDRLREYEKAYQDYTKAIAASGGSYPKAEINRELLSIKRRVSNRHELQL